MKKLIKFLTSLAIVITMLPCLQQESFVVDTYAIGCDAYELALVNNSGGFDTVACYGSFADAKAAMTSDDHVVRHESSLSPTKIIAIKTGVAYSYPRRSGNRTTMNIYQDINYTAYYYKTTYVVQHRELATPDTVSYDGNGNGKVLVTLNGFEGYASLKELDLVPMKFITNGLSITLGGNTVDGVPEYPFSRVPGQNYYKVVKNGSYTELVYYFFSGWASSADGSITVGPAADWMSVGDVYYSKDGHNYYSDRNYRNYVAEYYNYYQFLPLRSTTNISASTFDAFLASKGYTSKPTSTSINDLGRNQSLLVGQGSTFIEAQNTYGVNALLVYSMACLESAYGRSAIAVSKNNLFGWAAVDSDPNNASTFSSVEKGIQEHMAYNLRGYMDVTDGRFFGTHIGNKGSGFNVKYASDPYWGMKIASIAYSIDKFASSNNGELIDNNKYILGRVDTFKAQFKTGASSSSSTLYTAEYGSNYQKNHIVIINETVDSYYKVQSANAILSNGSILRHKENSTVQPATAYDFQRSTLYAHNSNVSLLSEPVDDGIGTTPEGDFIQSISSLSITKDGNLSISGYAYQPGIYAKNADDIKHYLVISKDDEVVYELLLTNSDYSNNNYKSAGFSRDSISLDVFFEEFGDYELSLKTINSAYTEIKPIIFKSDSLSYLGEKKEYTVQFGLEGTKVSVARTGIREKFTFMFEEFNVTDENLLYFKGIAFVEGYSAEESDIKHQIVLKSLTNQTKNEVVYDIKSSEGDFDFTDALSHGINYSHAWFEDSIDISSLEYDEYEVYLRVTVGEGKVFERKLYMSTSMKDSNFEIEGKYFTIKKELGYSKRMEIKIKPYFVDDSITSIPYSRNSYVYITDITANEEQISLEGTSFIWKANHSEKDDVSYTLILANRTTTEIYKFSIDGLSELPGDASWDNTKAVNDDYNYEYTWFDFNISNENLADGEYDVFLQIETIDYVSIFELCTISSKLITNYKSDSLSVVFSINSSNKNKLALSINRTDD